MSERDALYLPLPIRLRPRWLQLAANIPLWVVGAVVVWRLVEQGRTDVNIHLKALILLAIAAFSLALVLLTLLPRAPFVNITVDFDGLQHRRFLLLQDYTWTELSDFSVRPRRWWPRHRPPMVIAHFNHQMARAELGAKPGIAVEIDPRRYGRGEADELSGWLNEVRDLALMGQLQPHRPVAVPPAFQGRAFSLAPRNEAPTPPQTSDRNRKYRPPPTVERL